MKQHRNLGRDGPTVSAIGYGAMGLEGYYGPTDEANAIQVIRHAVDEGCTFIDTADAYGNGHNEPIRVLPVAPGSRDGTACPPCANRASPWCRGRPWEAGF